MPWTRWAPCSNTLATERRGGCRQRSHSCRQTLENQGPDTAFSLVELIGRNSNLSHLCKRWSELRKRINEAPQRPASSGTPPRSKRFLLPTDIDDIVHRYHAG